MQDSIEWLVLDLGGVLVDVAPAEQTLAEQEIGYAKPDRRGFDAVVGALDADPGRYLLIDDPPVNVDGARAARWPALLFSDAATLEHDLSARGIVAGATQ